MQITGYMLIFFLAWLLVSNAILVWRFRNSLVTYWREPVMRVPVIIFESDDWGPGPQEQAAALQKLRQILCKHTDGKGHSPVMTLGVTLAASSIEEGESNSLRISRKLLSEPAYMGIFKAVESGVDEGVFAIQLHGMEHYMPEVLLDAASRDAEVNDWLVAGDRYTEQLPDALQSRWLDARELPSIEHPPALIAREIAAEVDAFKTIFQLPPRIAVPNTFAWTDSVEKAWAAAGIEYVVTCGKRFVSRDNTGVLCSDGRTIVNGDQANGITYLVRDAYFEPSKGHKKGQALQTAEAYMICARPLLFETHRFNFTSLNPEADAAFKELDGLLGELVKEFPRLLFMSTEELGDAIVSHSSSLLDTSFTARIRAWLHRINQCWPLRRYTRFTGAQTVISLLLLVLPPVR